VGVVEPLDDPLEEPLDDPLEEPPELPLPELPLVCPEPLEPLDPVPELEPPLELPLELPEAPPEDPLDAPPSPSESSPWNTGLDDAPPQPSVTPTASAKRRGASEPSFRWCA
jgi:hypothetical protein